MIYNYSKNSSVPTTPTLKKKIPLTGAEKNRRMREKKSAEKQKLDQIKDQERKSEARANMSQEQREKVQEADTVRRSKARKNMP